MTVNYTNRKKDKYLAKKVLSKKGNVRYYPVKDNPELNPNDIAETLPENFEFYEHPYDGKVTIRKKIDFAFNTDEVQTLEKTMKKVDDRHGFIIDRDKDGAIIYIGRIRFEDFPEFGDNFYLAQSYETKLRFEKVNDTYKALRFCYLSSNYGWITMETNENLQYLAEKYCPHINKLSLLDFWIEGEIF